MTFHSKCRSNIQGWEAAPSLKATFALADTLLCLEAPDQNHVSPPTTL